MPSLYEGHSLAVLETMASGGVPIVSPAAAVPELHPSTHGFIIPLVASQWLRVLEAYYCHPEVRSIIRHTNANRTYKSWQDCSHELQDIIAYQLNGPKN